MLNPLKPGSFCVLEQGWVGGSWPRKNIGFIEQLPHIHCQRDGTENQDVGFKDGGVINQRLLPPLAPSTVAAS